MGEKRKGHTYISKGSVTPKNPTDRKRDVLTKWKILGTAVSLLWSRQPRAVQQLSQDAQRNQAQHPSNCRLSHLNQGHVVGVQDTSQQQKMKTPLSYITTCYNNLLASWEIFLWTEELKEELTENRDSTVVLVCRCEDQVFT